MGNPGLVGICRRADDRWECRGNILGFHAMVLARRKCRCNVLGCHAEVLALQLWRGVSIQEYSVDYRFPVGQEAERADGG